MKTTLVALLTGLALVLVPASPAVAAQAGSLDPSFGTEGKVLTSFGKAGDIANAVAIQPDGKIVAAGSTYRGSTEVDHLFALARYDANGTLDPTFGNHGRVVTRVYQDAVIEGVVIQPDGKIVVVGWAWTGMVPESGGRTVIAVARYDTNGKLDPTFGGSGIVRTRIGANAGAYDVVLQADGKIVVAGGANGAFDVARYLPDGTLDPSFSGNGKATASFASGAGAHAVAIQPDGDIVAAGTMITDVDGDGVVAVARFSPDGTLDPAFDGDGRVTTWLGAGASTGRDVAIQADGRIVVAGAAGKEPRGADVDFAIVRYDADGSLDATFSGNGIVKTWFGNGMDQANGVAIQPDGRIVAAGVSEDRGFALAGYTTDGMLDPTFSDNGKLVTSAPGFGGAMAVAIQPDGMILTVGGSPLTGYMNGGDFALARYLGAFSPTYRPDALIRAPWMSAVGNDVYNATGRNQTLPLWSLKGARFKVIAQNDGDAPDSFTIRGCGSDKRFVVSYLADGVPATWRVVHGTYTVGPLAPGASVAVTMKIVVRPSAKVGATISCWARVRSTNEPTVFDVVRGNLTLIPWRGCVATLGLEGLAGARRLLACA